MSKKLFGYGVTPKCEYCKYGTAVNNSKKVLCEKRGVTFKDFSCGKYDYDPLKRTPKKPAMDVEFNEEDFRL